MTTGAVLCRPGARGAASGLNGPLANVSHFVYRLYDHAGALLYVGVTSNIGARLTQHASSQPWWSDVSGVEAEQYPTMRDGLDAERAVIAATQPKHNGTYTDRYDGGGWAGRRARMAFCHDNGVPCLDRTCKKRCADLWHSRRLECNTWPRCSTCETWNRDCVDRPGMAAWYDAQFSKSLAPLEAWAAEWHAQTPAKHPA